MSPRNDCPSPKRQQHRRVSGCASPSSKGGLSPRPVAHPLPRQMRRGGSDQRVPTAGTRDSRVPPTLGTVAAGYLGLEDHKQRAEIRDRQRCGYCRPDALGVVVERREDGRLRLRRSRPQAIEALRRGRGTSSANVDTTPITNSAIGTMAMTARLPVEPAFGCPGGEGCRLGVSIYSCEEGGPREGGVSR